MKTFRIEIQNSSVVERVEAKTFGLSENGDLMLWDDKGNLVCAIHEGYWSLVREEKK